MTEEEELAQRLEEELKRIKVADLLVQTVYTVASLGYRKLGEDERDLDQARIAIEAMRALIPVVAESLPAEATSELNQLVANMQLAYAEAASDKPKGEPSESES